MTAEDHIVAWIESSRPHYDRLLEIEKCRKGANLPGYGSIAHFERATRLVADAYREMLRGGDASRSDPYSPADLILAATLILTWELEA
jgi:hypothetical protein